MAWNADTLVGCLDKLTTPGVIGDYRSFEVTECFRVPAKAAYGNARTNVLTVIVADSRKPQSDRPLFLTPQLLPLKGTKSKYGAVRYRIAPDQLHKAIRSYELLAVWQPGEVASGVGRLAMLPSQFVPADAAFANPWNSVLKNNFWAGSHVLELFDADKTRLSDLLEESDVLVRLAQTIRPHLPWALDRLPDRLGNVIIQMPVTAVVFDARRSESGDYTLRAAWRPGTAPRALHVTAEIYNHGIIEALDAALVTEGEYTLAIPTRHGGIRYTAWDDTHHVLVCASAEAHFINSMRVSVNVVDSSHVREFESIVAGSQPTLQRTALRHPDQPRVIGDPTPDPRQTWHAARREREERASNEHTLEFAQFGGGTNRGRAEALDVIHELIMRHGGSGTWLWDPYLDGSDVLDTLFFSPHVGADLRAITGAEEVPECETCSPPSMMTGASMRAPQAASGQSSEVPTRRQIFIRNQAQLLTNRAGNRKRLKLEFRSREGDGGWSFHDRFLIFPRSDRPAQAWSLGTSVNSLGTQHHVIQKVAVGDAIAAAFVELWNMLDRPENLIWSTK